MTPATTHCPERVAPATLAAWRDGALSAAEAAHVTAHVPACPDCRAVLSSYDTLDDALRRQPAPEPDERLWRAVQHDTHGTRRMRRASKPAQRLGGGLATLAAVVLLALAFAQVLHSSVVATVHTSATATTATTATTAPQGTPTLLPTAEPASPATNGPRPTWQQARLPFEPLTNLDTLTYAIVPGHGESAYACHAISHGDGGTLTFYRTTDRALHWATLTQLKAPGINLSECLVQVDALDGNRVLVEMYGQNMQTFKYARWYELSEDGGATWTRLDESAMIYGLSTWSGRTYAMRVQEHTTQSLWVSMDHLRTWQPIDQYFVGPYRGVSNFWVSPSGELLAEVTTWTGFPPSPTPANSSSGAKHVSVALWHSTDGGAHWVLFPAPTLSGDTTLPSFFVGQPVAGQPWHICTQYQTQTSAAASLACTFDGGRTWSVRPLLCTAAPCGRASLDGSPYYLASDGAVIMMKHTQLKEPGIDPQVGLYRLPQGSTTWQYLGLTTGSDAFFFVPTPNGGVLWVYAGGIFWPQLSGSIGDQWLPGAISTASYP